MKARAERATDSVYGAVDWHEIIRDQLQAVEERLEQAIGSDVPTVFEVSRHLLAAGGKRLRPAVVVLASQAAGGEAVESRVTSIAATVELIHMATLVHDDVIDHSDSRRGSVTANVFWGNKVSVLSGDCMLAKAFSLLAQDGDLRIMSIMADVTIRMSENEVLQALCEGDLEGWGEHYWRIIRGKTAGFLSGCCRCGAVLAGASPSVEEALAKYGMELGMAFQLTDDLLDIIGEPEATGKPIGSDLRDGKLTLPALLAVENMPDGERAHIRALLQSKSLTDVQIDELCRAIYATQATEITRDHARSYAERARDCLTELQPSPAVQCLDMLASQTINRIS